MFRALCCLPLLAFFQFIASAQSKDGNRLAYLDGEIDPYYVGTDFAKLTTPQWIGEEGITTAAILSIDDMRDPAKYEAYIRPILDRLKKIDDADGRAPLSIFTCEVDPHHPQLQTWIKEGVSIEVHTIRHPCPLLAGGDFAAAKQTVDDCIDLLKGIPNMEPVCYRMPCCDSMNSLSPRFFAEIFNKTTPRGSFLQADSSMFVWFNEKDKELSPELVENKRFTKYMPRLRGWVNWIENYPYPYVIGNKCIEFPSVIPSDWEAQNRHGVNKQETVDDLKAALDATVIKEGLFTFVFHPHGWIENTQVNQLIDHAEEKHGGKVRFLNLREATERITKNMLLGQSLRKADGSDNGVRILDLNNDGYMDVVIGNDKMRKTRIWDPNNNKWTDSSFPARLDREPSAFGVVQRNGNASALVRDLFLDDDDTVGGLLGIYDYSDKGNWTLSQNKTGDPNWILGSRFRDFDSDGICEVINRGRVHDETGGRFSQIGKTPLPESARLVDLNGDGWLDFVFSNGEEFKVRLFNRDDNDWSTAGRSGRRGENDAADEIPPIIRADGTNNGAWIHGDRFYWQNEDTASMQSQVDSRSFEFLCAPLPKKVSVLESPPLEPEAALATLATSLDLGIDLVAAEPQVIDPVDMAWGIDGKLWVVEMGDYPLGLDGKGKPGGRVRWLEDRDGDGRYEHSVVFMGKLQFPTGVMPWGEGVLVLAAPDLIYAEDRTGDGVADHREILFNGFGKGNQQHRCNGLQWGLDNWIHIANGDSNGVIYSSKTGKYLDISGRDLRINPDTGEMQAQTGRTQYGRNRDDWGNWFGCNNSVPMWHCVLRDHYLVRNPHVAPPRPTVNLVRSDGRMRLFPASQPLERFNDYDNLNRVTSACGSVIYRARDLPIYGDALVCEPVHNLIFRQKVAADGYSFVGSRPVEEGRTEFFTSTDPWCRPVAIRTGPDGYLYVADMYRLVIEHPEWIPDDWQKKLDLRSGHDRGRIYRVRPKGKKPGAPLDLAAMPTEKLASLLGSTNGTVRDLAHQTILWRAEDAGEVLPLVVPGLSSTVREGRVQTLSLLDGMGVLDASHIRQALRDSHPGVLRHAVRLCEKIESPPTAELSALIGTADPQLRLQLAFSLGEIEGGKAGTVLAELGKRYGADPYLAAAVVSSAIPHLASLAGELESCPEPLRTGLLTTIARESDEEEILEMLSDDPDYELALILLKILRSEKKIHPDRIRPLIDMAKEDAFENHPPSTTAIRLLGIAGQAKGLEKFLGPSYSHEVQDAAVESIESVPMLLRDWGQYTPRLREKIVAVLSRDPSNGKAVIMNLALVPDKGEAFSSFLFNHPDPVIRQNAHQFFQKKAKPTSRAKILTYSKTRDHQPNAANGRVVFEKNCALCHALDGLGKEIGPDLRALTDRSNTALLTAILDPNRAVEDKYTTYVLELKDGSSRVGMIKSETGTSLELTLPDGSAETVVRTDLESISNTARSLMPEGLENEIEPEEMADLIGWLSESRVPPKSFPGNEPKTIVVGDDGTFQLTAESAEIYGENLVFEPKYKNLGFWSRVEDHAVWIVDCKKPGRYRVQIDYACPDENAGNRVNFSTATTVVSGTGSWDNYETAKMGGIELAAGVQKLSFRASRPIRGFLLDLRTVILTPESED